MDLANIKGLESFIETTCLDLNGIVIKVCIN